jgi:hypothetical protein
VSAVGLALVVPSPHRLRPATGNAPSFTCWIYPHHNLVVLGSLSYILPYLLSITALGAPTVRARAQAPLK